MWSPLLIKHVASGNPLCVSGLVESYATLGPADPTDACPEAVNRTDPSVSPIDHKNISGRDLGVHLWLLLMSQRGCLGSDWWRSRQEKILRSARDIYLFSFPYQTLPLWRSWCGRKLVKWHNLGILTYNFYSLHKFYQEVTLLYVLNKSRNYIRQIFMSR